MDIANSFALHLSAHIAQIGDQWEKEKQLHCREKQQTNIFINNDKITVHDKIEYMRYV